MAESIRPKDLPPAVSAPADAAIIIDNGTVVQKATPAQLAETARPFANQSEAEAGADNAKTMTPLRTKQAIDSQIIGKAQASAIGVAGSATNMGTTPGTILSDNGTAKQWFQESEAAIEEKATAAAIGVAATASDLGAFTDSIIPDNSTAKAALQAIGTEVDKPYQPPSVSFTWSYGSAASKAQIVSNVNMALDGSKPLFGIVRQWNTSVGAGTVPYQVGRAESMEGSAGGGNFYTWNPIGRMNAGWTGDAATTMEVNIDNLSGINFGDASTSGDISNAGVPWATGINIIGIGNARLTAAMAVSAPAAAGQLYNRGYVVAGDCVRLWDYEAATSAPTALKVRGTRSGACIDLADASGAIGLFLNNNMAIYTRNGATSPVAMIRQDSSDNLIIGEGSAQIVAAKHLNPSSNNAYTLGSISSRWTSGAIGDLHLVPLASVTPTVNGELVIQATSNTSLTFKLKGSDGTVRSGSITLS